MKTEPYQSFTTLGGQSGDALSFLENILESSTEYSIIGKDLEGTILLWKEGARRLYAGFPPVALDEQKFKQVALTSFAMRGDEEKARQCGCDGYLSKPIDSRRLSRQVAEALERCRPCAGGGPVA